MTTERLTRLPASGDRPKALRRIAAVACGVTLALGASASQAQAAFQGGERPVEPRRALAFQGPPDVRLTNGSVTLLLHPYGSCWSDAHQGVCYDGSPPRPLASLGGTSTQVRLAFPRDGWHFRVTAADAQGRRSRVTLLRVGAREWRLDLSDLPNGHYRLDVFGRGSQGDVAAASALTLT